MTEPKRQEVFFWWTTPAECTQVGPELPERFPAYLREAYASRIAAGDTRARIFPSSRFPKGEIPEWPKTLIGALIHNTSSGIALTKQDLPLFKDMPGEVTDLRIRLMVIT